MLFQTAMPKSLSAISTDVTKPPTNLFPPASLTDLLILSKRSWKELCAVCFLPSSIKPEQLPQSIGPPWSWSWDSLPRSRTPQAHLLSSTCLGSSAILSFPSVASAPGISAGRAGPHRLQRKRQSQWLGSQRHSYVWAFPWPRAACRHSQFCIPMEKEKENNNNLRNKIKKNWKSDWRSNLFFFVLPHMPWMGWEIVLPSFSNSQRNQKESFAIRQLILHSEAPKGCRDVATSVLSPGCPASAWVLQTPAPLLSISAVKTY